MQVYRCVNPNCTKPILFEGDFVGTVQKICPKCKKLNIFTKKINNSIEKFCINQNK